MSAENRNTIGLATDAADYGATYYDAHLDGYKAYGWESEHWRNFFTSVAARIVGLAEPSTVLDVGCAKGLLVQALVAAGVDAHGIDVSDHAVAAAHDDVRDRLSVRSATLPIDGHFDLITCIEVLEHVSPADAQRAIDAMCAATDRILFSSCPRDFREATHINTQPTSQWAAWFAERGFFRRTDADTDFLANWAVFFERSDLSKRSLVERYEAQFAPLHLEVFEKRQALLEHQRAVDKQLSQLRASVDSLQKRLDKRDAEIAALKDSRTWKIGRVVTRPLGLFKH